MSIQRIEHTAKGMRGYQVRWYTVAPHYLSEWYADAQCGGKRKARKMARDAHPRVRAEAEAERRRMRRKQRKGAP